MKNAVSEVCEAIAAILQIDDWQAESLEQEHQALQDKDDAHRKALVKQENVETELNTAQQSIQFAQQTHDTAFEEYKQATTDSEKRKKQYQEIENQLNAALVPLHQAVGEQPYQALKQFVERQRQAFDTTMNMVRTAFDAAKEHLIVAEENDRKAQQEVQNSLELKTCREQEWSTKLELVEFSELEFLTAQVPVEQQVEFRWLQGSTTMVMARDRPSHRRSVGVCIV